MKSRLLFYIAILFIFILIIWIAIMNSNTNDLAPGTREGIEKGKRATQELKDEVYTRDDGEYIEPIEYTGLMGFISGKRFTLVISIVLFTMFVAIFGRWRSLLYNE
ncbi:hypothetical protein LCGC14_0363570 [marine sediment metagenome]|uniref:Uncharacterized protein n=1 Tax=marine sediment metagenome TaxID=412755 RepID=A0A0F9T7G9_9ZZZZ